MLAAGCADDYCDPDSAISCPDEACVPEPGSCRHAPPSSGQLTIRVSEPLPVLVRVYSGTAFETGSLVWSGPPQGAVFSLGLPVNAYAATALYLNGGDTVLAVDGDDVDYEVLSTCEGNCYSEGGGEVDLRLE